MNAVSEKTLMGMRYSDLYSNIETMAEKIMAPFIRKWLTSNSLDNNDPCMLRHTAGCSFYQGELILALNKSSLIEVDVCEADNTAQALMAA